MLASTFSRPRCAMPMTHFVHARRRRALQQFVDHGDASSSPPSSEKRLWPLKRLSRNISNPSASTTSFKIAPPRRRFERPLIRRRLHALLQPVALLRDCRCACTARRSCPRRSRAAGRSARAASSRRTIRRGTCGPDPKSSARAPTAPDPDAADACAAQRIEIRHQMPALAPA